MFISGAAALKILNGRACDLLGIAITAEQKQSTSRFGVNFNDRHKWLEAIFPNNLIRAPVEDAFKLSGDLAEKAECEIAEDVIENIFGSKYPD